MKIKVSRLYLVILLATLFQTKPAIALSKLPSKAHPSWFSSSLSKGIALFAATYCVLNGLSYYLNYHYKNNTKALFDSVELGSPTVKLQIALQKGGDVEAQNAQGLSPLMVVLQQTTDRLVLAQTKDPNKHKPFWAEELINQLEKIKLLLHAKSSLDVKDRSGKTARDYLKTLFIHLVGYPSDENIKPEQQRLLDTLKREILGFCYTGFWHTLKSNALARLASYIV